MLRKTISYTDFEGEQVEKVLYFDLTVAEMAALKAKGVFDELDSDQDGDISDDDKAIKVIDAITKILAAAYGERHDDEFVKSDDIRERVQRSLPFRQFISDILLESDPLGVIKNVVPAGTLDISVN